MGKAIVIILAAVSLILLPVSFYYIGDGGDPPIYNIDFQGNFYDVTLGGGTFFDGKGFSFFKFTSSGSTIFTPDAWNQFFTSATVFGLEAGTFMMICWYVAIGMSLVGIIIAFFKPKISGIFFLLTALAYGFQAIVWYLGTTAGAAHFPIPIGSLLFLVIGIVAFTTKKKEAYYYSPGYSYGYGRR